MRTFVTLLLAALVADIALSQDDYCFARDPVRPQLLDLSTKTAYQYVKGRNVNFDVPDCQPDQLWLLSRHGTRFPSTKFMTAAPVRAGEIQRQIILNHASGKGKLCQEDLNLIRDWRWDSSINPAWDQWLSEQGWDDLEQLGQTYRGLIEGLTGSTYRPELFNWGHTATQRTNASFRAFFDGVFGPGSNERVPSPPVPAVDLVLRPYETCDPYNVRKKNDTQVNIWRNSAEFQKLIRDVSSKLGFDSPLSMEDIGDLWEICRYEQAWNINSLSSWCAIFTREQHALFNFDQDVDSYWQNGYGFRENRNVMCYTMQDLLRRLQNRTQPVTGYFSHSSAVELFLHSLNWFSNDEPLTGTSFSRQQNREWRSTAISPFTANLGVVRYSCRDSIPRMKFWFNEKPIYTDFCRSGACPVQQFLEEYQLFLNANCADIYCQ